MGTSWNSLGRLSPLQRLPNLADVVFGALCGLTPHPKFQGWSGQRRVEIVFVSEMQLDRINIEIGGRGANAQGASQDNSEIGALSMRLKSG